MTKSTRLVLAEFNQIQIPQLLEAMYAGVRAYNAGPNKYTTSKLWSNPVASDEYKKCGLFIAGCLAFLQENPERYKAQICFLYLALKKSENDIWRVVLGEIAKQIPYNLEQTAAQAEEKGKEQTLCYARVVLQKLHLSNKTIAKRVDEVYATIAPGLFKSTEKEGLIGTDKANSGWSWLELVVFQNFITPVFMDELKRAAEADVLDSMEPLATDYLVKRINLVSRMAAYVAAYNQNKDGLELEKARCYSRPEGRLDEFIKSGVVAKWIKSTDEASKRYPELLPPAFLGKIPEYFNKKIFDALKEQMWAMIAVRDFNQLERRRAIYGALLWSKLQSLAEAPLVRYPHVAEDSKGSHESKLEEWMKHNFELYRARDQAPERLSYSPISASASSSSASSPNKQKDSPTTTDEKKPTVSESKRPAINNQAIPVFLAALRIKAFSFSELLADLQTGINNYLTQSKANHQGNARAIIAQQSLDFFARDVLQFSAEIGLIYLALKKLNTGLYKNYIAVLVNPKTQIKVQRLEEKGTEDLDCVEECLRQMHGLLISEINDVVSKIVANLAVDDNHIDYQVAYSVVAGEKDFELKTVHFPLELIVSPLMQAKISRAAYQQELVGLRKALKEYHAYRVEIAEKITKIQQYNNGNPSHRFYTKNMFASKTYCLSMTENLSKDKRNVRGTNWRVKRDKGAKHVGEVLGKVRAVLFSSADCKSEGDSTTTSQQSNDKIFELLKSREILDVLSADDQLIFLLALLADKYFGVGYFYEKNIFGHSYPNTPSAKHDYVEAQTEIYSYLIEHVSKFFFNYKVLLDMVQGIDEILAANFSLQDKKQYILDILLLGRSLALTELSPLEGQCVSDQKAEENFSEPKTDYILTGFLQDWMEHYFPSVPVSAPPMVVDLNSPPPMQFFQQQINVASPSVAPSAPPQQDPQQPPANDPPILPPNISALPQPNGAPEQQQIPVLLSSPSSVPIIKPPIPTSASTASLAGSEDSDEGQDNEQKRLYIPCPGEEGAPGESVSDLVLQSAPTAQTSTAAFFRPAPAVTLELALGAHQAERERAMALIEEGQRLMATAMAMVNEGMARLKALEGANVPSTMIPAPRQ